MEKVPMFFGKITRIALDATVLKFIRNGKTSSDKAVRTLWVITMGFVTCTLAPATIITRDYRMIIFPFAIVQAVFFLTWFFALCFAGMGSDDEDVPPGKSD